MPTLLLERQNLADIQTTFSSWDSCMSKAYCKWPVIAAIIVGALIVISLLTCLFRCLCCGAECCCACFSCCNACCPSPRRRNKNYGGGGGYQAPPPPPPPTYPTYNQYAPPAQQHGMPYASGGLGYPPSAHTATFDAPARKGLRGAAKPVEDPHADSLPAMPSWDTARDKRVSLTAEEREAEEQEAMEMQRLQSPTERTAAQGPQSQALLAAHAQDNHDGGYAQHDNPYGYNDSAVSSQHRPGPPLAVATGPYSNQHPQQDPYFSHPNSAAPISPSSQYTEHQPFAPTSHGQANLSALHAAPYHDYTRHEQFVPSLYGSQRTATTSGAGLDRYDSFSQQQQQAPPPRYYAAAPGGNDSNPISPQHTGYAPSIPPSYHSQAVSPIATSAPPLPMGIPAALQPASPVGGPSAAVSPEQQVSNGLPAALQPGAQAAATAQKMPARRPVQGSWREV